MSNDVIYDPNADELLPREPKHELATQGLEIRPKIRQSHKMSAEFTIAFPAWNLSQFPPFLDIKISSIMVQLKTLLSEGNRKIRIYLSMITPNTLLTPWS